METADVNLYREQLFQVTQALQSCDENQREELLILKSNIEELLTLANDEENGQSDDDRTDNMSKEFELFMAEMEKEGAVSSSSGGTNNVNNDDDTIERLGDIEGKKCRAPHTHQWGNIAYHNAMICSVFQDEGEVKVKVLFTNPTHQEMLPCPYYYDSDCKFSDEKCRFSHGEIVLYSSLQEYIEPKFDLLSIGSPVLAKQDNNLWYRAIIQKLYDNKCVVKFECNKKSDELLLEHIFPLDNNDIEVDNDEDDSVDEREIADREDIINMSLLLTPSSEALGDWEKYTKGMGSKLMQKMGYIVGTGLGKNAEGRIDPVTAVILPAGKSLDHCMKLREQAGGDKNLFSVERKLKRLQKKQQRQNEKAYEQQAKKTNVFDFINSTLATSKQETNLNDRAKLKEESHRSLNIKNLTLARNMRKVEEYIVELKNTLNRHLETSSDTHQLIINRMSQQQDQLKMYEKQAQMIKNELKLRSDRKKMTEF